ncbi:MAG: DUF302 domain-containing protein [Bacteroidales bacterium]|nr:DUF302 domain-containing protein [Bacteroidales bacterium]
MEINNVIVENESRFGFEETIEKLQKSAELRGWKIPTVHDLQETLRKNQIDVQEVKVIELCKPEFSGALMKEDPTKFVSALMPCRISVYCKTDGKTYISRINSGMLSMFMGGTIGKVMGMAGTEMELIMNEVFEQDPLQSY